MKEIVALCKRRGFIFPASDIYGGLNGFWDYGPLGVELKNNLRDAWWKRMVTCPPIGPDGQPLQIVGLDAAIIQNPKAWEASGHVGGFNDPMVDDTSTKKRYREDHLSIYVLRNSKKEPYPEITGQELLDNGRIALAFLIEDLSEEEIAKLVSKKIERIKKKYKDADLGEINSELQDMDGWIEKPFEDRVQPKHYKNVVAPEVDIIGTFTDAKQFNLMFHTYVGATATEDNKAYLRPETCGPIFLNFNNVVDSSRVKMPFGIAQIGKAFRNEVTPRNFIFRSREFEQMELEWFCEEDDVPVWFEFWLKERKRFWLDVGIPEEMLYMNEIAKEELAHYSERTVDMEFEFPFTSPGFGELEGVAHRGNFDLTQQEKFSGAKLQYFDQEKNVRYTPHVIEPSCGLTRGVMALLSAAYTVDASRPSGMYMNFHPSMAPKKAAILPLTAKDGQPEIATKLYMELREHFAIDLDIKQNIGKRYARQDEIGTPYCFTIDNQTAEDGTVTVRERNTMAQERIALDKVKAFLFEKLNA